MFSDFYHPEKTRAWLLQGGVSVSCASEEAKEKGARDGWPQQLASAPPSCTPSKDSVSKLVGKSPAGIQEAFFLWGGALVLSGNPQVPRTVPAGPATEEVLNRFPLTGRQRHSARHSSNRQNCLPFLPLRKKNVLFVIS